MIVLTGNSGFVAIGIIILVFFVLMLVARSGSITMVSSFTQPLNIDPDAASDPEVVDALAAGQKINAIKRYRELTGVGLKEAKDAIEYLQRYPEAARKKKSTTGGLPVDAGIREMLRRGQKLEAIRAYQEFTGVSLSDARDEVERIAWEEQEADQRNNSGTQSQNQMSNR